MSDLLSLIITTEFLGTLVDRRFTAGDHAAVLKALALLDANEKHPSLRVHQLKGDTAASGPRLLATHFVSSSNARPTEESG